MKGGGRVVDAWGEGLWRAGRGLCGVCVGGCVGGGGGGWIYVDKSIGWVAWTMCS